MHDSTTTAPVRAIKAAGGRQSALRIAIQTGTSVPSPEGLNREQLKRVLEAIACRMGTLEELLMLLQQRAPADWTSGVILDAAQQAATAVGGMADAAIGGDVSGDMNHWLYGPNFADAGREGGAA